MRIPWIFAALILGLLLAWSNPFSTFTSSETFHFLGNIGMYFMLFLIGFEINFEELLEKGKFIISSAFFIILLEALFGSLVIHFIFGYNWLFSVLVSFSFATVGEAILAPILDEFDLINTDLGQMIVGIGTLDDIIEVAVVIAVPVLLGARAGSHFNIWLSVMALIGLFGLAFGLIRLKRVSGKLEALDVEALFLLVVAVFSFFLAVGKYAEATALGALLAGVGLKSIVPNKYLSSIESDVKSVAYGVFGPLFFLLVGVKAKISYLLAAPLLILLVVGVTASAKLLSSVIAGSRKKLGIKKSLIMGVGLSVRFSTSIVIIKLLFEAGVMGVDLYTVLVASTVIYTLLIPSLLGWLVPKWNIMPSKT